MAEQNHQTRRDFLTAFIWSTIGLGVGCLMPRKCQQQIRPVETAVNASEWQHVRTFRVTRQTGWDYEHPYGHHVNVNGYDELKALDQAIRERRAIMSIDCDVNGRRVKPITVKCVYDVQRTDEAPGYAVKLISMKAVGDDYE